MDEASLVHHLVLPPPCISATDDPWDCRSTYTDPLGKTRTWEHAERTTRPQDSEIDGVGIIALLERDGGTYHSPIDTHWSGTGMLRRVTKVPISFCRNNTDRRLTRLLLNSLQA